MEEATYGFFLFLFLKRKFLISTDEGKNIPDERKGAGNHWIHNLAKGVTEGDHIIYCPHRGTLQVKGASLTVKSGQQI